MGKVKLLTILFFSAVSSFHTIALGVCISIILIILIIFVVN